MYFNYFDEETIVVRADLVSLFRPTPAIVILTALLTSVMIIGLADRYAFTCGGSGYKCEGTGIERPVLYGIPCYCWTFWIISSAPLVFAIQDFPDGPRIEGALFGTYSLFAFVANIIYYYLASCVVFFVWRKIPGSLGPVKTSAAK